MIDDGQVNAVDAHSPRVIEIRLPWPPSVNRLYVCQHNRKVLSREGREYRKTAVALCMFHVKPAERLPRDARYSIEIDAYPPDSRRRDLDNLWKITLDSITCSGVAWEDDSQVDREVIERMRPVSQGVIVCTIRLRTAMQSLDALQRMRVAGL